MSVGAIAVKVILFLFLTPPPAKSKYFHLSLSDGSEPYLSIC